MRRHERNNLATIALAAFSWGFASPVMEKDIEQHLKEIIIETLNLDDMTSEEIDSEQSLMEAGLTLDSIDALELVVRIEQDFGIKIKNSEEARDALQSVQSLKAFVEARQAS